MILSIDPSSGDCLSMIVDSGDQGSEESKMVEKHHEDHDKRIVNHVRRFPLIKILSRLIYKYPRRHLEAIDFLASR